MSADAPTPGRFRRQILRNTAATGLSNGWTIVLTLAATPVLLRALGPTAFGVWAVLQTFSAASGWFSLADLGLRMAATRATADRAAVEDHAGLADVVRTALATIAALAVASTATFALVGRWVLPPLFNVPDSLADDLRLALLPFCAQLAIEMVGTVVGACLDGLQRIDYARGIDSLRRTLALGSAMAVALAGGGLVAVVSASALSSVVVLAAALVVLRRLLPGPGGRFSRARSRDLLHYGRRVWLLTGTGVIHRMMDRTIVGIVLGPAAVTLVEIATQLQNGVNAVVSATSYAATSSAAWVHSRNDPDRLRELVERGSKYTCLVTIPLCALVAILAGPVLEVWLPEQYSSASGLVVLAMVALAMRAPMATGSNLLVGIGAAGSVVRPAGAAVIVNLVASIVLVDRNGIAGAFVATIIASFVIVPLLAAAVAERTGVSVRDQLRGAVVPALAPTAAVALLAGAAVLSGAPALVVLVAGSAAATIGGALVAYRWSLDHDERRELAHLIGRSS